MKVRGSEFYKVQKYQTERFGKSAIPFMIKLLNDNQKETKESFKKLQKLQKSHTVVPVNHVCTSPYHCDNNK